MATPLETGDAGERVRSGRRRGPLAAAVVAVAGCAGLFALTHRQAPPPPTPLPTVVAARPLQREVTEWDDYVGRFAPSQSVEVRPRVSGAVVALHFRDGEIVRKGQLLFTIDPRPFAAALAEARAGVATAASALALARSDLGRADRLTGDEALSTGEMDSLRARVEAASASLAAARARVAQRALDVEFTQVRAPISGRVSDRRADVGNLVSGEGSAATLLTTINALDPIYFGFDGSEALFLKALRNRKTGEPTPVEVKLQDEATYRWKGRLDFTDNGLDPRSGTIRARAILPNPTYFLTPGMFGNMRLASGGTVNALLVPDTAVQTDQTRKTLLVMAPGDAVAAKEVTLGPVVDGLRVIRSGLVPTDRVIIDGTQSAIPGSKVRARSGAIHPQPQSTPGGAGMSLPGEATFAR